MPVSIHPLVSAMEHRRGLPWEGGKWAYAKYGAKKDKPATQQQPSFLYKVGQHIGASIGVNLILLFLLFHLGKVLAKKILA